MNKRLHLNNEILNYVVVGVGEDFLEVGMVVAERHGRDLHVDVEQVVAVRVGDVVTIRLVVVGEERHSSSLL